MSCSPCSRAVGLVIRGEAYRTSPLCQVRDFYPTRSKADETHPLGVIADPETGDLRSVFVMHKVSDQQWLHKLATKDGIQAPKGRPGSLLLDSRRNSVISRICSRFRST